MSIRDSHNRKVSFDTREELGHKIDKLVVMIGKLAARDSGAGRQFKPQSYQGRGRGQNRGNYDRCNCDQQSYQNKYRSDSRDRRQYREDKGRPRYEQNYSRGNFRGNMSNFDRQNSRGEYRNNYRNKGYDRSRIGLEKGHFLETVVAIEIGVQAIVGPGQDQEPVQIETE